jgi:hypothetical protein
VTAGGGVPVSWMATLRSVEAELRPFVVPGDRRATSVVAGRCEQDGLTVRVVRGRKMRTVRGLFDEFAAAFQFPYYFGENWAAFDECLADLDWLPPGAGYVVVISEPDEVLCESDVVDFPILVSVLQGAAAEFRVPITRGEWWDRPAVPFHVVLVGGASPSAVEQLWRGAGANVVVASVVSENRP